MELKGPDERRPRIVTLKVILLLQEATEQLSALPARVGLMVRPTNTTWSFAFPVKL